MLSALAYAPAGSARILTLSSAPRLLPHAAVTLQNK